MPTGSSSTMLVSSSLARCMDPMEKYTTNSGSLICNHQFHASKKNTSDWKHLKATINRSNPTLSQSRRELHFGPNVTLNREALPSPEPDAPPYPTLSERHLPSQPDPTCLAILSTRCWLRSRLCHSLNYCRGRRRWQQLSCTRKITAITQSSKLVSMEVPLFLT
jgi:hypothetical protein